jgi:hypothetical protein
MPKLNLHLDTKQEIDFKSLQWNNSLLASDVVINVTKQKKALKLILCNVVKYRDAEFLYSRRHETKLEEKHNPLGLSNKTIYNVVDKLAHNGMLTHIKGDVWYTKDKEDTYLSRFKANQRLIDLADSLDIAEDEIEESQKSFITLKDSFGRPVKYEDTPYSSRIEQRMNDVCEFLNKQNITYQDESITPLHLVRSYKDYDNSKEFKFGGRAWAPYMQLSSEERSKIKINGQSVSSHDYSASLTSIVYSQMYNIQRKDVASRVQPYDVLALDRSVVKQYMNTMLNTTKDKFSGGINSYYNNPKTKPQEKKEHEEALKRFGGKINNIRDAILELNEPIESVLLKGKETGAHFSWIEANLVHEVQHYACCVWDIPCLTVYDEFIVPQDKHDAMEELLYTCAMPDEYKSNYTQTLVSE